MKKPLLSLTGLYITASGLWKQTIAGLENMPPDDYVSAAIINA